MGKKMIPGPPAGAAMYVISQPVWLTVLARYVGAGEVVDLAGVAQDVIEALAMAGVVTARSETGPGASEPGDDVSDLAAEPVIIAGPAAQISEKEYDSDGTDN